MKTKFFKKLSFVLVVAMVLSVFAPAASVFAAKKPALNSTKKYLHLGRVDNGQNEFNFNIKNKQKGSKYQWESSNEAIAVVNEKNGVTTAKGVGKATISVTITDKDGKDTTLKAQVIVRDNIETVKISNPVEKVGVGEAYDYNRSFITEAGSTKKTSAITRWEVEPNTATIDDKGVFVATEPGEYTVTARSFQSKARYNSWLEDSVKYADYVLADDTTTVVVAGSMVEAKQVNVKKVEVLFDSAMEDVKDKFSVYQLVGESKVKQIIEKVEMSDDKKVATISFYANFTAGATYVVEFTDLDSVSFVAATSKVEDVAAIQITTSTAVYNEPKKIEFKLLNANGVDITTSDLSSRVTMESGNENGTYFNTSNKELTVFLKDASATITASFHTYKYDNTGQEIGALTTKAVIIGVDKDATNISGINAWTIVDNDAEPNFGDVKQQISISDKSKRIFVEYNTKTGSTEGKVDSYKAETYRNFSFTSSDKNYLIIDDLGNLYPVKEGYVTVIVNYGTGDNEKTPIGAIPITISSKRDAGVLTLSTQSVTLSNNSAVNATAEVEIKLKDQLGADFSYDDYKVERISQPSKMKDEVTAVGSSIPKGNGKITFYGAGINNTGNVEPGQYIYRITVKGLVSVVYVNILDGSNAEIDRYELVVNSNEIDIKATKDNKGIINASIDLFGYNNKNAQVKKIDYTTDTDFKVEIEAPKSDWNVSENGNGSKVKFAAGEYALSTTSGSAIVKSPTGTYKITAFQLKDHDKDDKTPMVWVPIHTQHILVVDSQKAPVLSEVKSRVYDNVDLESIESRINVAHSCLKFTLNGAEVKKADIVDVEVRGTANEFSITKVTIRETVENSTNYFDHTIDVVITVTKK